MNLSSTQIGSGHHLRPAAQGANMMPSRRTLSLPRILALPVAALALAGLGATQANAQENMNAKAATVVVAKTDLGKVLTDARGRTLYLFKKDAGSQSACTDQCATFWPPLL